MKRVSVGLLTLCVVFLLILCACDQDLVVTLPPEEDTATPEEPAPTEEPEPEPEDTPTMEDLGVADLLAAGTAMKWYDDGYLVFVPGGEVILGDNQYENNPEHQVDLGDYWIYMFPVTNGQYSHCVAAGACSPPAGEEPYPDITEPDLKDDPVIGVSWDQADSYCRWMKGRLPSEAEWEKAARGPQAYTFPWGEDQPTCDLLNFSECENLEVSRVYEYPEGRSYYQAFDMAGNTFEWVADLYEDDIIAQLPGEEPAGPPEGTERSVRGSSYTSEEELLPSARLFYHEPEGYRTDLGFRCVIGEGQPDSFASPCIQTVYVPGVPPPWLPGPHPVEEEPPEITIQSCYTDIGTSYTTYCPDPATQTGGLDLSISALGSDEVYVKSWSSSQGGYCVDGTEPLGCFGPEGTAITFEICATCTPSKLVQYAQFYCDCGYTLSDTNPPICIYTGGPPQPGQTCPAGFVYDPVEDICQKIVLQSQDCPAGYEYDPNTDCCTATFAEPSPDPQTPSSSYLTCPPGSGIAVLTGEWVVQGMGYAICEYTVTPSQLENCITRTFNLGDCPDETVCRYPKQYNTKNTCEAAGCKWDMAPTGGFTCMYP